MIPRHKLEQLQALCNGKGKKDLYDLVQMPRGPVDHAGLLKKLTDKEEAWSSMPGRATHLEIIEQAVELLKTPADKVEYDRFLLANAEPQTPSVNPQGGYQQRPMRPPQYQQFPRQQPWGYQEPPMPMPRPRPQQWKSPQPKRGLLRTLLSVLVFGPIKLFAWLVMVGVGLAILMQVAPGLLDRLGSPPPSETPEKPSDPPPPPPSDPPPPPPSDPPPPPPPDPPPPPPPDPPPPPPPDPPPLPPPDPPPLPPPDPPPPDEPVRIGSPPRKTWSVTPEYPRLARLRRIQGIVILQVTVGRQGEVADLSVLRSAEGLDEAAVEAARQWRYQPTIMNGRPVSVIFTDTVMFQIEN